MAEIDESQVLSGEDLKNLYKWVDAVKLSRPPSRNFSRDFSDGVLVAEVIHHYLPRIVELHNYATYSATGQKKINWQTLNRKVFTKLGLKLDENTINQIVEAKAGAIEQILWSLRKKINEMQNELQVSKSVTVTSVPSARKLKTSPLSSASVRSFGGLKSALTPNLRPISSGRFGSLPPMSTPTMPPMSVTKQRSKPSKTSISNLSSESQVKLLSKDSVSVPEKIPDEIVFQGHRMVPVELLEAKDEEIRTLEHSKTQLTLKIQRMEKLVEIKDNRIIGLEHNLNNSRMMFEQVTPTRTGIDINGNFV